MSLPLFIWFNCKKLLQNIVAFRNTISDIQSKTVQLQQRVNQGSAQPAAGGGYQDQEMKNSINTIQNDVKILLNKPQVSSPGGNNTKQCLLWELPMF